MACSYCKELFPQGVRRSCGFAPESAREWERLRSVICDQCGAVLPVAPSRETLLDKLVQLARFGLADGATPILDLAASGRHGSGFSDS